MSRGASPLRFLGLVLGAWLCARLAVLAPGWLTEKAVAEPARPADLAAAPIRNQRPGSASPPRHPRESGDPPFEPAPIGNSAPAFAGMTRSGDVEIVSSTTLAETWVDDQQSRPAGELFGVARPAGKTGVTSLTTAPPDSTSAPLAAIPAVNRWSLSTWAFVRRGDAPQLATAGTLGGSQVGARATYAMSERFALSGRLYAPINRASSAEAALGFEVQPLRAVPVRILAERRQAIGRGGRSGFALLAHGGLNETPLIGRLTIDAYAQAGIVGLQSRDAFVDGAVRLGVPVNDRFSLGVGAWGAAQPGLSRVDVGPQASYRLPILGGSARMDAQWRIRIVGDARPGSGPALTVSTDF